MADRDGGSPVAGPTQTSSNVFGSSGTHAGDVTFKEFVKQNPITSGSRIVGVVTFFPASSVQ